MLSRLSVTELALPVTPPPSDLAALKPLELLRALDVELGRRLVELGRPDQLVLATVESRLEDPGRLVEAV